MSGSSHPAPLPAWLIIFAWTAVFLPAITLLTNPMPPVIDKDACELGADGDAKADLAAPGGLQMSIETAGRRSRIAQSGEGMLQMQPSRSAAAPVYKPQIQMPGELEEPDAESLLLADDGPEAPAAWPCDLDAAGAPPSSPSAPRPPLPPPSKGFAAGSAQSSSYASIAERLWNSIACRRRSGTLAAAIIGFGLLQTGLKPAVLLSV
eukprot:CAMPEP_0176285384 /NCGR_PEP_ID=MMETSP0121_2-20121125/52340_1 /TAXON_ID=160619 /ORGANISM="Kryptoperidinium foliaceum, Strain CCMP 1326" /LENGTH=206 /DNA_ID=CAMNT_0017625863 /DNA_START=67 /DNA_END=687 /DNA_ORIENTATION=+